jgi:hypothetical protein
VKNLARNASDLRAWDVPADHAGAGELGIKEGGMPLKGQFAFNGKHSSNPLSTTARIDILSG